MKIEYKILDQSDPEAVLSYERAFFKSFYGEDDPLIPLIWKTDRAKRSMRSKVSANFIAVATIEGAVMAAMAFNGNTAQELQIERIGFTIDRNEPAITESLVLFNLRHDAVILINLLRAIVLPHFAEQGIRFIYGSCTQKRLRGFLAMGFSESGFIETEHKREYLVKADLQNMRSFSDFDQ